MHLDRHTSSGGAGHCLWEFFFGVGWLVGWWFVWFFVGFGLVWFGRRRCCYQAFFFSFPLVSTMCFKWQDCVLAPC